VGRGGEAWAGICHPGWCVVVVPGSGMDGVGGGSGGVAWEAAGGSRVGGGEKAEEACR
jgi:hypothetical protein